MDRTRIVLEQPVLFILTHAPHRLLHVAARVLAAHHEAHLAGGVGGDRGPGVRDGWENAAAGLLQGLDDVHVQPGVLACKL